MADTPIQSKGLGKILDALGDEVVDGMRAAVKIQAKSKSRVTMRARGEVELVGRYGFDKDGHFGFAGVATTVATPAVTGQLNVGTEKDWSQEGVGTVKARFWLEASVEPPSDEP